MRKMMSVLVALLLGAAMQPASAQAPYPNRPIRIVVPFGPGGFADITMRLTGQQLSERTGQQVVIENRPSAGGIIAGNAVTGAPPDGYTLFVMSSGIALSKSLIKTMPFDPVTAFAPISTVAMFDNMILVRADSPMRTPQDMLTAARANPSAFNIGTINPGSTQNVTAELIRSATAIPMTIVPHRTSAEVLTSLLRDDTQIGVESYAALKSPIDAGSIRAIAGSGSKRSPMQPNVPTLLENGVNAAVDGWNSLVAPAGTPKEIVAVLNGHIRAIAESADFKRRMLDLGGEPNPSTPEELDARLRSDIEMWPPWSGRPASNRAESMAENLKIDAHVHVFTTDMPLIDNPRHAPKYSFTHEELIATLDKHGVGRAVIAAASPWGDYSDYTLAAVRAHPKRLRADYEGILWIAILAPAGTPQAIVDKLAAASAKAARAPDIIERLQRDGVEPVGGTPSELAGLIARELPQWRELAKAANIKLQ